MLLSEGVILGAGRSRLTRIMGALTTPRPPRRSTDPWAIFRPVPLCRPQGTGWRREGFSQFCVGPAPGRALPAGAPKCRAATRTPQWTGERRLFDRNDPCLAAGSFFFWVNSSWLDTFCAQRLTESVNCTGAVCLDAALRATHGSGCFSHIHVLAITHQKRIALTARQCLDLSFNLMQELIPLAGVLGAFCSFAVIQAFEGVQ